MHLDRIRMAMDLIESLPDKQVALASWQHRSPGYVANTMADAQAYCGTLACAAGWIALSPEFQAMGVRVGGIGQPIMPHPSYNDVVNGYDAMAELFGISIEYAESLFSPRTTFERVYSGNRKHDIAYGLMTDRQLWLSRMRKFLFLHEPEEKNEA